MELDIDPRESSSTFISWIGGYKFSQKRWNNFSYLEETTGVTRSMKIFNVIRLDGSWPSDEDLITLCDGDAPNHPSHFGGKVTETFTDTKKVVVFTD